MTSTVLAAGWSAAAAALVTALLVLLVLPRLPEPADGEGKPLYRDLATRTFAFGCAVLAGVAAAVAWLTGPPTIQPLWSVLSVLGVLLAVVDARTTWLPLRLTHAAWLAMAAAAVVVGVLGGGSPWSAPPAGRPWPDCSSSGLAGLPGRLRVRRRAVRAPGRRRGGRATRWSLLIWALLLGSLAGAGHGLLRLALRRAGPFPYAPSMLARGLPRPGGATWAG